MRGELPSQEQTTCSGTRVGVLFSCWLAPLEATLYGTIVTNPRRRRNAGGASFRSVGWRSSNPSLCWLRLGTAVQRPHVRSCHRRPRTLCRGSVAESASSSHAMGSEELCDFPFSDLASSRLQHKINKFFVAGA